MAKQKKKNRLLKHLKSLGFTNRLCIYALTFLLISIVLGFILAVMSIKNEANFTLAAYTCSVAPIGTFISIAIGKAVDKSKHENLSSDGTGLVFAAAQSKGFVRDDDDLIIMPDNEDLSDDTIIE